MMATHWPRTRLRRRFWILFCLLPLFFTKDGEAVPELTLDGREGGFFLRNGDSGQNESEDRFTLLQSQSPVTVRSQFGPFVVKQTVLPFANRYPSTNTFNSSAEFESLLPAGDVDISAHVVTTEITRDRPVLRVLFHTSRASDPKLRKSNANHDDPNKGTPADGLCVALYVHGHGQHLMAACSPGSNRDGVCLAQATLPAAWWPPLESRTWKTHETKTQRTWIRVEYAALHSLDLDCSGSSLPVSVPPGLPSVFLADVPLSGATEGSYEEVKSDDVVRILVPQAPVYPKSKVYVPVYLQPNPVYPPYVFVIRARVKSGLRILGAQVSQPSQWSITVELNPRQTVATVTAFVKDTSTESPEIEEPDTRAQEVFTWLFEVDEDAHTEGSGGGGRIMWQLRYMLDSSMAEQYDFDDDNARISSRLDVRKDDVQAVIPIAKSEKLLNTAVLNGRQVSQPMRVFIISQAGKVGDVTLQSSCHAADESILKVSPSCTSVYLDGSEIRGSHNASVLVKYGTYTGQAHFLVWMPELPLIVRVSDTKLSQIKGWKTPQLQRRKSVPSLSGGLSNSQYGNLPSSTRVQGDRWTDRENLDVVCRLRYQQSTMEVYTRFFSVDHNSGRESYLLSRRVELRITELVAPFLRVADGRIALLKGNIIQGLQSGRTEVQVLSPITGRVIGAKEFRVGTEKETITHLEVTVITGLRLNVVQDDNMAGVYVAQKSMSHKLTTQYQEGLLDIQLHFSDGTATPMSDIIETDYRLSVDTFDSGVVAFAPMAGLHHPRVIAIGEGKGDLLHITMELAERCQKRRSQPLAMAYSYIDVDFSKDRVLQNDARLKNGKGSSNKNKSAFFSPTDMSNSVLGSVRDSNHDINSILYQDAVSPRSKSHYEPAVQARQNLVHPSDLTPLEIGMYALLGVFCVAILVFLVSCSVFAVKYRRKQIPPTITTTTNETVAHAHDWVWLGRATLERNSVNTRCSQTLLPMADFNGNHPIQSGSATTKVHRRERKPDNGRQIGSGCRGSNLSFPGSEISIRITTNPQELQEEETALLDKNLTSVTNPNAIRLPSEANSSTVTREKRVRIVTNPVPPPIPPTANPLKHIPAHPAPPIPPHRNNGAPPVPPHNQHNHHPRHVLGRFPRGIQSDAEWEAVTQGMDYDELIEYFENLKESNA